MIDGLLVTLVVAFGFLPQNFGKVVRTHKWRLPLCECRWGGGSTWRWWGLLNAMNTRSNSEKYIKCIDPPYIKSRNEMGYNAGEHSCFYRIKCCTLGPTYEGFGYNERPAVMSRFLHKIIVKNWLQGAPTCNELFLLHLFNS